jgi:hypothetical protein
MRTPMKNEKTLLSRMLEEFEAKNGRKPEKIVVAPAALLALGARRSLRPVWNGVPVEARLFELTEVVKRGGTKLGVYIRNDGNLRLVACDLA